MRIRAETEADRAAVRSANEGAFERSAEADLVEVLRGKAVAEVESTIVGHVLFSPVALTEHPHLNIMGLGPLAVAPAHQRKGIGSALVREGLERCRQFGCHAVVVVGHPQYYPRFGFVSATKYAIRCEYDVPEGQRNQPHHVFMIAELEAGALGGASGLVRYDEVFGSARPP
jgi:putative acetyltransferase